MYSLSALLHNPCFVAPALGWLIAQVSKTIIYIILNRDFRPERLVGSGGMPSSHSSTVCARATATACKYGFGGFYFPMSMFFAFIVMYDAMGVRRETGEQAKVLNEMMNQWREMGRSLTSRKPMENFKEFVGHTPLQVTIGAILGIVIGLITCRSLLV